MSQPTIKEMMEIARQAQKAMYSKTQEEVDAMVRAMAKVVNDNAEMLAEMAVTETRMGSVKDKITKNKAKSELIYNDIKDRKTVGIINKNEAEGVYEIAEPVGVVGALIPTTNPTVTSMCNSMLAIKGRNVIIMAPHPRAKGVTVKTVEMMIEAAKPFGLPDGALQIIKEPSMDGSQELMQSVDVVLATGGGAMVKAAYSSGKPSYGVGPGNVPVLIHNITDYDSAAKDIVVGKTYDNGLICASEQAVIVNKNDADKMLAALEKAGCYFVSKPEEKEALRQTMYGEGHLNPDIIGQPATKIAEMAGISLPAGQDKVLLVPEDKIAYTEVFSKEKLSPVLAFYVYDDLQQGLDLAKGILTNGGLGHTAGIHTLDEDVAAQFAVQMPASRVLVNQPTATSAGGGRQNGLIPTTTMGCGSWGNNATTDNINVTHLLNIKRLAFKQDKVKDTSTIFA